jgi:hypothetical protein
MKTQAHVRAGRMSCNHNETLVRESDKGQGLRIKTRVRAGKQIPTNHNETLVRDRAKGQGLSVKTRVRAGFLSFNHNETLVSDRPRKFSLR